MKTISTAKVLFGVIGYALLVSVFHSWQKGYSLNMAVFVMSFGSAIAIIGLAGSFYIFTSFIYLFIKGEFKCEVQQLVKFSF